jgi:hypothetical protein
MLGVRGFSFWICLRIALEKWGNEMLESLGIRDIEFQVCTLIFFSLGLYVQEDAL